MRRLAFDTSPLSHFARAGRLPVLAELVAGYDCVLTQAVMDELERGSEQFPPLADVPALSWISVVRVDALAELQAFAEYARRLGSGARDIGEASTLAWAERHNAIAVLDERAGTRHGRERGVEVHGTLWLIAGGVKQDLLSSTDADALVSQLRDSEAWFPHFEDGFEAWARNCGLLD